jgi:hypothetical protein
MKITALQSKRTRIVLLATSICVLLSISGCGRKQTAPLSEGGENSPVAASANHAELPLDQQTEQKLDPLTAEDVTLYLKIMRAAAERIEHPAPTDTAALEGARKILAASAAGRVPSLDDVKILDRANLEAISRDQIVAEEMKTDARTYRGIAEAIESVIPNPALTTHPRDDGKPAPEHIPTPLENRLSAANAANQKFLIPYRDEIQKLIAVVRNPANLPK